MTKKDLFDKIGSTEESVKSGFLDLSGTGITALPDNLTVGGSLDLSGTGITALPDNLTVGDYLDLSGTGITALPDNLTVGGNLYLSGTGITDTSKVNKTAPAILSWMNWKYISVDDIFCEVISHKGPVYKCRKIFQKEVFYVVEIDGKVAHGDTIKEAKEDLIYKISNRNTSRYESMTLDSEVTHAEGVEMYRVITGACAFGTRDYVENRIPARKEKYTIREIIKITTGEYGNEKMKEFFHAK